MTSEEERPESEGTEGQVPEPGAEQPAEPSAEQADAGAEQPAEATQPDAEGGQAGAEAQAGQPAEAEEQAAEPETAQPEEAQSAGEGSGDAEAAAASATGGDAEAKPAGAAEGERPAKKPARAEADEKSEVVPGADLEPIAVGEEEERELTAEERARAEAEEEERRAREAQAAAADEDAAPAPRKVSVPDDAHVQATGKRKSAVARVLIRSGSGAFQINGKGLEDYFDRPHHQSVARQALVTSGYDGSVDVRVRVHGGGISGQAGAVRHGIARALTELEPELRGELKRRGLLTRDDRRKERKKAGLKKARKRPQFSKR